VPINIGCHHYFWPGLIALPKNTLLPMKLASLASEAKQKKEPFIKKTKNSKFESPIE
jgi:hypothetical protein